MVIRRKSEVHENHERWLVSYADFITLLFAFFVVMFAAQADRVKAKAVSDSVRDALEHGQLSKAISTALGRGKHDLKKAPEAGPPPDSRENPPPPSAPSDKHPP